MTAAVLSIGTEITRGEILNTNALWLCDKLTALGFEVTEVTSVDDDRERIISALRALSQRHEILLCTGGLGPTTDDITSECASLVAGQPLVRDGATVETLQERFRKLGRTLVAANLKQADFPAGSTILTNAVGTAPGFALLLRQTRVFFFPGVPAELHRIFKDHVESALAAIAPRGSQQIRLRTFGQPESTVGEMLAGLEEQFPWLTIGYRATFPEIEVKVLARAATPEQASSRAEEAANLVRQRLASIIVAEGEGTLVGTVASALRAQQATLALAESCTGGLLAHLITSEPASEYFRGGVVAYENEVKTLLLGVSPETLAARGAVSREVAIEMAAGAQRALKATHSVAITGLAGPTGGTPDKPVGLVHWAVGHSRGVEARERVFAGTRERIQRLAAFSALDLLRRVIAQELKA